MFAGILRFAITVAALPLSAHYLDGVTSQTLGGALAVGAVLAVIYTVLRPIMRLLLSVFNFCTLGLLYVVVDGWMIYTATLYVPDSVTFDSFWWALGVAVLMNTARMLIDAVARK